MTTTNGNPYSGMSLHHLARFLAKERADFLEVQKRNELIQEAIREQWPTGEKKWSALGLTLWRVTYREREVAPEPKVRPDWIKVRARKA